jgi:hypothetical protein
MLAGTNLLVCLRGTVLVAVDARSVRRLLNLPGLDANSFAYFGQKEV